MNYLYRRNRQIVALVLRGYTLKEVSDSYRVSVTRARQIVHQLCSKADKEIYESGYRPNPEPRHANYPLLPSLEYLRDKRIHFVTQF